MYLFSSEAGHLILIIETIYFSHVLCSNSSVLYLSVFFLIKTMFIYTVVIFIRLLFISRLTIVI